MNRKKRSSSSKKSKDNLSLSGRDKLLAGALLALVATIVLSISFYNWREDNLDRQDAERFATLKSDFLTLQKEFNEIDKGWEYSEGCTEPSNVYSTGEVTCTVSLTNSNLRDFETSLEDMADKYADVTLSSSSFESIKSKSTATINGALYREISLHNKHISDGSCSLGVSQAKSTNYVDAIGLSCRNHAHEHYFERID